MDAWKEQLRDYVNTMARLKEFINVTPGEAAAIAATKSTWGTTPYFASLMDKDDPNCPIRRQVIPSMEENVNKYGIKNYLIWKENRATEEKRPDCIARQYHDRIAFTVTDKCAN